MEDMQSDLSPASASRRLQQRKRAWLAAVLFTVIVSTSLLYNLTGYKTLGSHEVYAVVPARTMLTSGDWVVPRIAQAPRLRKPPLAYWVIAGSAALTGELNEFSARLPAAVSATLLALLVGYWTARWHGRRAGYLAAFVQLTTVYSIQFGRKAEIDMLQTLLMCGALCIFALGIPDGPQRDGFRLRQLVRWTAIYGLLGLTWLAKFHYGMTMVLLPIMLFWVVQKQYRGFWNLLNPVGLGLLAAAVFIWPSLLLSRIPDALEIWKEQTIGRALGELGNQPLWFYVPHLLFLPLPWTPLIVAAIPASWRRAWSGGDARHRFLWLWLISNLVVAHASANKNSHYIMSALPMLSIIAGPQFVRLLRYLRRAETPISVRTRRQMVGGTLVACAGMAIGASLKYPFMAGAVVSFALLLAAGTWIIIWLISRRDLGVSGLTAVAVFCLGNIILFGNLLPHEDHRISVRDFVQQVREQMDDEEIFAFCMDLTSVEYYVDDPVRRVESIPQAREAAGDRNEIYVVTYQNLASEFTNLGQTRTLSIMKYVPEHPKTRHEPLVLLSVSLTEPHDFATDLTVESGALHQASIGSRETSRL